MESLKLSLDKFFTTYNKRINITKIISMFKIKQDLYDDFIQAIYELEK